MNVETTHPGKFKIPAVDIWTYGQNKKKMAGDIRIKRIMTADSYVFTKKHFASGGMAKMYVGLDPKNDYYVAIKEIAISASPKKMLKSATAASNLQSVTRELAGAIASDRSYGPLRAVYNAKKSKAYIIQNLLSGTLKDAINILKATCAPKTVLLICAKAVIEDLTKLQRNKVLHLDLHSQNILYDKKRHCVEIIDFGGSEIGDAAFPTVSSSKSNHTQQLQTFECTARDDLFTLGVTFAEYAAGRDLFTGSSLKNDSLFSSLDLEDIEETPLRGQKKDHISSFITDTEKVCPDFTNLYLDMMDLRGQRTLGVNEVSERLNKLVATLDDTQWSSFEKAWSALPEHSQTIRQHMRIVRESVQEIRTERVKRIR